MVGSDARVLHFGYPRFYRWFFGAATLCFVLLFALPAVRQARSEDHLVAALVLGFALVSLYAFWRSWARVTVGERSLTLARPGRSTRIYYAEITRVRNLAPEHSLLIEGSGRRIYIKKQLQRYGLFYGAVAPHFPIASLDYSPYLPLTVHTRGWVLFRPWLLVLGGLLTLGLAPYAFMPGSALAAAGVACLGALLLAAGLFVVCRQPRAYKLSPERLHVVRLVGSRIYPAASLQDLHLVTHSDDPRETACLRLVFKEGVVRLRDQAVDYAPEALARALRFHYMPKPTNDQA